MTDLSDIAKAAQASISSGIVAVRCPYCRGQTGVILWTDGPMTGRQRICGDEVCRWEGVRVIVGVGA